MNQAKYEYSIRKAAEEAFNALTKRAMRDADEQHEKMLQETWMQLDQDEQAIEEFCNGS